MSLETFIAYSAQFGEISPAMRAAIHERASYVDLKKGHYFSEAGKIPRQVGFMLEGVVRGFYVTDPGEEITRCFISEGSLVSDYINFEANKPSTEHLQACTDCRLLVFSKQHWESLSSDIPGWDNLKSKMVYSCMFLKSRKGPVISEDATTRYRNFMETHPTLLNRIPLAYIASYLGVTQQSLSRIRKNVR